MKPTLPLFTLVVTVAVAAACGNTLSSTSGDGGTSKEGGGGGGREGGCLITIPTQGAPCDPTIALCNPGNECCSGMWICGKTSRTWGLVRANCVCPVDAGGDATPEPSMFACGPSLMCEAPAERCLIVEGHLAGMKATYACTAPDAGGVASCAGQSPASSPGTCGCYESPSGQVTVTECPP